MTYRTWGRQGARLAVVLAVLASACGSDDDSKDDGGTGTTSGTATGTDSGTDADGGDAGGGCSYLDVPGECTITAVEDYSEDTTKYEVSFTFVADDPALLDSSWYTYDENEVHVGLLSPKDCATQYGITEQSTHPCELHVIEHGACTPVMFELTELGAECQWS